MTGFFRFLLVSLAFTLGTTNLTHAASFDCTKATTETEIAICNDPELSLLDERMSKAYSGARKSEDGKQFKQRQLEWIKTRNSCLSDIECLKDAYEDILSSLKDFDYQNLLLNALKDKQLCEENSREGFASPSTSKMLGASVEYNECIAAIVTNLITSTTSVDHNSISNDLEILENSYQSIIYHIFNSRKECAPTCGTMFSLFPTSSYTQILEDLISSVAEANYVELSLPVPTAAEIIMSFPICKFKSSLRQRCGELETQRLYTNQMIEKINLGQFEAEIETDDWYYSISEVEETYNGFTFIFTDDGKSGSYLTANKFFAKFDKDISSWIIVGEELTYRSGVDQEMIGKYEEYDNPVQFKIDK